MMANSVNTTENPAHRATPARSRTSSGTEASGKREEFGAALHSQTVMNVMLVGLIMAFAALLLYGLAVEPVGGALGDTLGAMMGTR